MPLEIPLDRVQRWLQTVVVHPGTVEEAVTSTAAQADLPLPQVPEVVLPSKSLTPAERVGIYHGMYLLRMKEALESDYPGLKHFLGDEGFAELVRGYVQAYPSRSYTLNRLGDHLPDYIRSAPGLKRRDFCHDLARLELAVSQVFDAPETPALTEEAIASVPAEAWETARLKPVEAFQLLSLRYPVNAYLQSIREEKHDHPKMRRKDTWVAIYRRDYAVWRLDLTRPAHDLLTDLVAGRTLGEAVAAALRRVGRRALKEDQFFRWFREWVSGGVFRSVELPTP